MSSFQVLTLIALLLSTYLILTLLRIKISIRPHEYFYIATHYKGKVKKQIEVQSSETLLKRHYHSIEIKIVSITDFITAIHSKDLKLYQKHTTFYGDGNSQL